MPVKDLTGITAKDAQMLSVVKPLQEFGKLDKCLSRYGTRFEFNNEKQVIFSSDVNSEDTFVILEGVISLRREENVLIGITQAPYINEKRYTIQINIRRKLYGISSTSQTNHYAY